MTPLWCYCISKLCGFGSFGYYLKLCQLADCPDRKSLTPDNIPIKTYTQTFGEPFMFQIKR